MRSVVTNLLVAAFAAGAACGGTGNDTSVSSNDASASSGSSSNAGTNSGGGSGSGTNAPSSSGASSGSSGTSGSSSGSSGASSSGQGSSGGSSDAGGDSAWGTPVSGSPPFSGPTVTGTVTVEPSTSVGTIGSGFAGFSFEKTHLSNSTFVGMNAALIELFKLLGPTVARIGADDVDKCTWVPTAPAGGGAPPYSRSIGTADVDGLAAFAKATGARIIYGLDYSSNNPSNSAAEAAYAQNALGANLYGFEIGNEINRYGTWPGTLKSQYDSIANAVLTAAPGAKLVGPAAGGGDALSLTTPFAADEASKNLVLLTQHYYAGTAGKLPDAQDYVSILLNLNQSTSQTGYVGTVQTTNTAAVSNRIPDGYRVGECNTLAGHGQDGISNALISALWGLDFMFTTAEHGASGVNFHGGETGMDGSAPFYYSPIEETNGVVTAANPLFYGMLLFSLAGTGDELATTAVAGNLTFNTYALARTDGALSVVLSNKDTSEGVKATVNVGRSVTSASAIYLQGPAPASLTSMTGITLAGAGISAAGAWNRQPPYALASSGNTFSVMVPPASAALVRVQ